MVQIVPQRWMKLWNEWEIRATVLLSLSLQILLISLGNRRKRDPSQWLRYTLWVAYLSADWVASVSLGTLSSDQGNDAVDPKSILRAIWAPVILLHPGGPDTITAYAMEDNALWLRHLLGLLVQASVACYVFVKSLKPNELNYITVPLFVTGIIIYGERTWALRSASDDYLRKSLLPDPDPGPNYAKFMEEYTLKEIEGYKLRWRNDNRAPRAVVGRLLAEDVDSHIKDAVIPGIAYDYFQLYKRLFADLILSFQDLEKSKSFFLHNGWKNAFHVIELELSFVFDAFYTKAAVVYLSGWGWILRLISLTSICVALVAFYMVRKHGSSRIDVGITYVLLGGAVALELLAIFAWLSSYWALIWLNDHGNRLPVRHIYYKVLPCLKFVNRKANWSNSIAQYNLINKCFQEKHSDASRFPVFNLVSDIRKKLRPKPRARVQGYLKRYIFEQLLKHSSESSEDRKFCTYRGALALDKHDYQELNWSIEKEFEQSIILWHVATDLCYHKDKEAYFVPGAVCEISKLLSDYIMYLLVKRPEMLPNGIGQIRFQDTCAEARDFIRERSISSEGLARLRLLNIKIKIMPINIKGDRSKSVLFDACRRAKFLQKLERKWEIIGEVWIEILAYAANQCRSVYHAQQLAQGGEFLTHVWLLLAHLGLSEHFQISEGHGRVELEVK